MRHTAWMDGQQTWAEKVNGRWIVGGDRPSGTVEVLLKREGRPAIFRLKGCFLKFVDWM